MKPLYNFFIFLFRLGIGLAAFRNGKAAAWISGRKNLFDDLRKQISSSDKIAWVHCASAGELEQGKPVIEALKDAYPEIKVLVSFFSPSGYEVGKKYAAADFTCYLPLDTEQNATHFLDIVQPRIAVFVKYEFWYHLLSATQSRGVPLLLVSAIFRPQQAFFKWYGSFYRNLLAKFSMIFVQDESSVKLLHSIGVTTCSVAGDTRFDRVSAIARAAGDIQEIAAFAGGSHLLVAGSTWGDDEKILSSLLPALPAEWKMIIAPHEITEAHIAVIVTLFPGAQRYSTRDDTTPSRILIIDNIGMLSRLYQYATIAYIGGGFNKSGIHNTLEAAVWGKPVIFGPNFTKFREARELVAIRAAFPVKTEDELQKAVQLLLEDRELLEESGSAAAAFVAQHEGATQTIISYIQENRLLTIA